MTPPLSHARTDGDDDAERAATRTAGGVVDMATSLSSILLILSPLNLRYAPLVCTSLHPTEVWLLDPDSRSRVGVGVSRRSRFAGSLSHTSAGLEERLVGVVSDGDGQEFSSAK